MTLRKKSSFVPPEPRSHRPVTWMRFAQILALISLVVAVAAPERVLAAPEPIAANPGAPVITAESAILVDTVTGTILFEKNAYVRRPMASTTKIITSALILERGRLEDTVAISARAARTPYANLNAKPGEQIGMLDLLYAILLRSSNDGCVAAAEHVAGSEPAFVALMNQRARELGTLDTHFVTTNGLHHPNHFTTAADLSRITRHALRYPLFNQIIATPEYRITTRTLNLKDSVVKNHNQLLTRYVGADGVKTGYVRQAGRCLVASATRLEGTYPWRLIAVVLNSKNTYGDSSALLDYGFKSFQPVFASRKGEVLGHVRVAGGVTGSVAAMADRDAFVVRPRSADAQVRREIRLESSVRAPISDNQRVGKVIASVDGLQVAEANLVAPARIASSWTAVMSLWGAWFLLIVLGVVLGPRYARSFAEGALRGRHRISPPVREPHFEWPGHGGRAGRF